MVSGGWWMVYGGWLRLVLPLCLSPFLPPFLPFLSHPTYLPISLPPVPPLEKHGDIFVPRRTPTPPYLSLLAPLNLPPYLPPYSLLPFLLSLSLSLSLHFLCFGVFICTNNIANSHVTTIACCPLTLHFSNISFANVSFNLP